MKLTYFDELACIVADIDRDKNRSGISIIAPIDLGISLIAAMKSEMLDTGTLLDTFVGMHAAHNEPQHLPELIDKVHDELIRLLGEDAWRIYGHDEVYA